MDPKLRLGKITGSGVAAIFGVHKFIDAFDYVAMVKGELPPAPPTVRQIIGKALEPGVLNLYTYVTGREVIYLDETECDPVRPWMAYTPDAICANERRIVDAKVVSWDQRREWGATADDIPEYVQLQMWWYMAGKNCDFADVAALLGDGLPRVYTVERDREAERVMLARVEEWWRRYIVGNERPPIGGSEHAALWLQQAFPHHKRPDLRAATEEEIVLLEHYAQVRSDYSELKSERERLENEIKLCIAEREGLTWSAGKFTWRRTKDREVVKWESMARGLLNNFVKDEQQRQELFEFYTDIKPGTRRIWFDSELVSDAAGEAA